MPLYDINGVSVEFPYEAYECQLDYMRSVLHGLEHASTLEMSTEGG